MKVIKICYPRVKKTYTYNITQEMLDNMDFTWDEFQNALSDDEHESCLLYTSPSPRE